MEKSNVKALFTWLDLTTETIQQQRTDDYLDCLIIAMETLFYQEAAEDFDDILTYQLETLLKEIDITGYKVAEIRHAIQLAILKGMKDATQQQHLMTPESVGLIIGYLTNKLFKDKQNLRIFDPAGGTGNLLMVLMEQLNMDMEAFACEIDPTLIRIAAISANLQQQHIELIHQDGLSPLLLDPVDLIIADLPVGYYPDDVRASEFKLKADSGHSYSHHLFIEQSMNYTKEAGYLIFVIPDSLFTSDQASALHTYIRENAHIIGLLRLPESAFKTEKDIKSIFILQKKGAHTEAPKQPMLVQLPALKNAGGMEDILAQMDAWFIEYQS